ncbi:hypothetical protein PTKIN_Ptkin06aG0054600 [Pterospermum kingtungense]
MNHPNLVDIQGNKQSGGLRYEWIPPVEGCLKFNTDGAARGQPGSAGIEGLLRDSSGKILAAFSKSIGVADSNLAELLAVKEAFGIFGASIWVNSHALTIESDSMNIVKWVLNPRSVPWRMRYIVQQIESLKLLVPRWSIQHVMREGNVNANELAKGRVDKLEDWYYSFNL